MEARVAAICDKIKEHRDDAGKPMSARRAAVISAMIDNIAATDDAEEMPMTTGGKRKKARKGGARWNEELSMLDEAKPGVVVKSVRRLGCDVDDILREACFMAACRGHPSLVGYRGVTRTPGNGTGGDGDEYSLVVDSVGPSLAAVLRDSGRPFPEPVVRRVMRQLLGGAEAMAERGVVHRDINPANIQFAGGGAVRIASGFGAAKHAGEKDPPRRFAGTNGYAAPEVLLGNACHGAPADAWSLGCVMAELLTGAPPPFFAEEEVEEDNKNNDEQLRRIFDVLGVPARKAWQALKPGEAQQRQRRSRHNGQDCSVLRELVPEQVLSEAGFEVLSGLLTCDPKKRLTAAAALRCPWFADNADGDVALVVSAAVSKITGAATKSWTLVMQMVVSFAGRTLGLLRLA